MKSLLGPLFLALLSAYSASCPVPTATSDDALSIATTLLTGKFSTAYQAETEIGIPHLCMRTTRIWPERTDGNWLYFEQTFAAKPATPFRQRVYCLAKNDDLLTMTIFALRNAKKFAAADAAMFDGGDPDQLSLLPGCVVHLAQNGPASFEGLSPTGKQCKSSYKGAAYSTSQAKLSMYAISSFDQGFAKNGTKVWGLAKFAHFRRV